MVLSVDLNYSNMDNSIQEALAKCRCLSTNIHDSIRAHTALIQRKEKDSCFVLVLEEVDSPEST